MKLAISGKGGVGKTTLVALLSLSLARDGAHVFAIDADPDANLAQALGLGAAESPTPLIEMKELIAERTESQPDTFGKMFKLNPQVSDIPATYSVLVDGVHLLVLGAIEAGGGGCACPENVFLRNLLGHLVLARDEAVIVDMEAGVEHLGRATVRGMDALLVVVEPGLRSLGTAQRVRRLAADISLHRVLAVANKVRRPEDLEFIEEHLEGVPLLGSIPFDERLISADIQGVAPNVGNDDLEGHLAVIRDNLAARLEAAT